MNANHSVQRDEDIVIVSAARTAIGKFGGALKTISAIDMGALVVREAVTRAHIDPCLIDECIIGQVGSWGENGFIARCVSLKAGLPETTTAFSVNRQCGSGLQALLSGMMAIQTGMAEIVVAGATESLSQLPYYIDSARFGTRMGHKTFEDGVLDILTWPLDGSHNGTTAEAVAKTYGISREEQDRYAAQSHARARSAIEQNIFRDEIVPVEVRGRKNSVTYFSVDENPREGVTQESLSKLKPCFVNDGTGSVTAGNSSSLNDGAAALVIMTRKRAQSLGIKPLCCIRGCALAGCSAELMGYAPYYASKKLAEQLHLDLENIGFVEINEAFASQVCAVMRDLNLDESKVNIYGGGISLGHPIGATGAILAVKCAYELGVRHPEKEDALITMCIGGGQGISMYLTAE